MTLETLEKALREHPLWEREVPVQMQLGPPYLYLDNGALYLRYGLRRQILERGRLLIFADRFEIELLLPEGKIVSFRDLYKGMAPGCESPVCTMEAPFLLTQWRRMLERLYARAGQVLGYRGPKEGLADMVEAYQKEYGGIAERIRQGTLQGG